MLDSRTFRRRLIIELAIGIGGSIALILLAMFVSSDARRRADEVVMARNQAEINAQTVETLALLGADADTLPSYQVRLDSALPPKGKSEQAVLALRKELLVAAASHQLTSTISFGTEVASAQSNPGSIAFTIILDGALTDIISFARELERVKPVVGVESIEISKKASSFGARIEGKLFTQ